MTVPEIQNYLHDKYDTEISLSHIPAVVDAVIIEVKSRQSRPLESIHPLT